MAERFTAAQGDVVWTTNTGRVEADIEGLRRRHNEAVGSMSTAALRATAAQAQLDRALAKHGPTSTQAVRAEIAYRNAIDKSTTEVRQHTAALEQQERHYGRVARGALAGTGALRGLGRSVAFASSSFLGGFGLTYAIKTSIDAAEEQLHTTRAVRAQLEAAGVSWDVYGRRIEAAATSMARLGIQDDVAERAFVTLFRATGNVTKAIDDLQLTADIAAARHLDLEKAAQLVAKVEAGNVGLFRRAGLAIDKNATSEEALAVARQKFAGQAVANAKAQDVFNASLDQSEEVIGGALRPELERLFRDAGAYLDRLNRTGELQRDVNKAVRTGGEIIHGVGDAVEIGVRAFGKLNKITGGTRHSFELLTGLFILKKLGVLGLAARGVGAAVSGVGASAVRAEAQTAVATGAMVKEWEAVGAAAAAAGAAQAKASAVTPVPGAGGFNRKKALGLLVRGGVSYFVAQQIVDTLQPGTGFDFSSRIDDPGGPGTPTAAGRPDRVVWRGTGKYRDVRVIQNAAGGFYIGFLRGGRLGKVFGPYKSVNAALYAFGISIGVAPQSDVKTGGYGGGDTGPAPKPKKHGPSLALQFQRAEERQARAEAAGDTAGQRAALEDERAIVQRQIAGERDLKKRTDLYRQLATVNQQIDALDADAAAKSKAANDRRAAAARKRAAEAKKAAKARHDAIRAGLALDERKLQNAQTRAELTKTLADDKKTADALIAFYRRESHDQRLTAAEREAYVSKALSAEKAKRAKSKKQTGSAADFYSEAAREFALYGSNIAGPGGVLSGQDERGALGHRIVAALESIDRHAQQTARHTRTVAREHGPRPIGEARTAAAFGYS